MFSLIYRMKELYKPLADDRYTYGAYSDQKGNFEIRAVGDHDVFTVAAHIPSYGIAELIAELLNVAAGVATKRRV